MGLLFYIFITLLGICYSAEQKFINWNLKYHVSRDAHNWFQALVNCKSAGMELASITSETDQANLEKYLKDNGHSKGYWLSGTNLGNGEYYWASTGKLAIYTNWLPNQPDNAKLKENKFRGENCIQWGIYNTTPTPTGWNDLFCALKLPYICEETEFCNKIE